MGATISTLGETLKIDYLPVVREQLNNATVLLAKAQKNTEDVYGKQWQLTVHYGRNSGVGARAERGTLPSAGNQSYKNPYGAVKYNYGKIELTGKSLTMRLGPLMERFIGKITFLNSVNILGIGQYRANRFLAEV